MNYNEQNSSKLSEDVIKFLFYNSEDNQVLEAVDLN